MLDESDGLKSDAKQKEVFPSKKISLERNYSSHHPAPRGWGEGKDLVAGVSEK